MDINKFIFSRTAPAKKVEIIENLTQTELLSITPATIVKMVKDAGTRLYKSRDKEMRISAERRTGNDWNSTVEGVRIRKGTPMLDIYIQYENTDNGTVSFSVESAWNEPDEVRKLIERVFPEVKLYYQCEESGMGIYTTNDDTGEYFPERYYIWVEYGETMYHNSLEALIKDVEETTGSKNIKALDSCKKALESYSGRHSDLCFTLEKFTVLPD